MTATVWVPKDTGHDFSHAETFGPVRFMLGAPEPSPFEVQRVKTELSRTPVRAEDYLVMAGPPVMCALALERFREVAATVKVLIYHAGKHLYLERMV